MRKLDVISDIDCSTLYNYSMKIVIAGGFGFLGSLIAAEFKNDEVVILSRRQLDTQNCVIWDGKTIGPWVSALEGCDVVINLAGFNVNCRYTRKNRKRIIDSRVQSTAILGAAIRSLTRKPGCWIQLSSATIYRHEEVIPMDEINGIPGSGFSEEVVKSWEKTFLEVVPKEVRGIIVRSSIVIGNAGGAFPVLKNLATFGLGGKQGSGTQMVSWISGFDFTKIIRWFIENSNAAGVYNVTAPNPERNNTVMEGIRSTFGSGIGLPATAWMIQLGCWLLRTEPELVLKSRYVIPKRLLSEGFEFSHPTLKVALKALKDERN